MKTLNEELDGFRDLLIFVMVNDRPSMYHTGAMVDYLNKLSKDYGYADWVEAYHDL